MKARVTIHWLRRDLRLTDNRGLYYALRTGQPVLPVFIFDRNILDDLPDKADRRVTFIHAAIHQMQEQLAKQGSSLHVCYNDPITAFQELLETYAVEQVFANHDYEPYGIKRDREIAELLQQHGIPLHTYKDQVIFEKDELVRDNGEPYTVFTPYSKKWKNLFLNFHPETYATPKYFPNFYEQPPRRIPALGEMGFRELDTPSPIPEIDTDIIRQYHAQRDFPAVDGTSHMSVHLRFGTVSIRQLAAIAGRLNEVYLNELIWRDFFQSILWHFPHLGQGLAFKKEYDRIVWRNHEKEFESWCRGKTGYPIVDAGMRELNETGFMHNRLRMITASFLTKHLLIDWRWGEAYFAQKLIDFDLAANNGGWQWAAGSGCDAAPYFRIFNPELQTKKFDPALKYIHKWVPELEGPDYPLPIVDHAFARKRCLGVYKKALGKTES